MPFEIEQTIQSQYAASPRINALAKAFYQAISPQSDIQLFYDKCFNLATAEGWGLDVWGRIVGIERKLKGVYVVDEYFGFAPLTGVTNEQLNTFDNAPFFSPQTSNTFYLQDSSYRLLIQVKAMANISTGTLPELNRILKILLPDKNLMVLHVGTMKLRIVIQDELEPYQKELLTRGDLPPMPAGVGWETYELDPHTFGFLGSGLEPFDQGVFSLGEPVINGD